MKKLIALLLFPTVAFAAGPITPPTPRSAFGQSLMLVTDAAAARNLIGITPTNNMGFNNNQLATDSVTNINIKTGPLITNAFLSGGLLTNGTIVYNNQTLLQNTNLSKEVTLNGLTNENTYYVANWGSDITALKGHPERPWATLSNAIYAAPNGASFVLLAGQRFTNTIKKNFNKDKEAPILITNRTDLTILGYGAAIYGDTNLTVFAISNCSNITIRGLTLENKAQVVPVPYIYTNTIDPAAGGGVFAAIEIGDSDKILIDGVTLRNFYDHGIVIDPAFTTVPTTNYTIINSTFENIGSSINVTNYGLWDGSAIVGSFGGLIANNTFRNCANNIEIYPVPTGVYNKNPVVIVGNSIQNAKVSCIVVNRGGAIIVGNRMYRTQNAEVADATSSKGMDGIYAGGDDGFIVSDNIIKYPRIAFNFVGGMTNVWIKNNKTLGGEIVLQVTSGIDKGFFVDNICEEFTNGFNFTGGTYKEVKIERNFLKSTITSSYNGIGFSGGTPTNFFIRDNYIYVPNFNRGIYAGISSGMICLENNQYVPTTFNFFYESVASVLRFRNLVFTNLTVSIPNMGASTVTNAQITGFLSTDFSSADSGAILTPNDEVSISVPGNYWSLPNNSSIMTGAHGSNNCVYLRIHNAGGSSLTATNNMVVRARIDQW